MVTLRGLRGEPLLTVAAADTALGLCYRCRHRRTILAPAPLSLPTCFPDLFKLGRSETRRLPLNFNDSRCSGPSLLVIAVRTLKTN